MKVYICTQANKFDWDEADEIIKVFDSIEKAQAWVDENTSKQYWRGFAVFEVE